MRDEYSLDRSGWARFSDDRKLRYRLARSLDGRPLTVHEDAGLVESDRSVVFVMLNPSTADAFKPDRTVAKCCEFARRWGADVLEVVNLFAIVSSDPRVLETIDGLKLGDDDPNDAAIFAACTGAARVVAAWGNHGWRRGRGNIIRERLQARSVELLHLGLTKEDRPLHPLARGKNWIPLTREPEVWT